MRRTLPLQASASVLVVAFGLTVAACSHGEPAPARTMAPIEVAVHEAAVQDLADPFEVGGTVRARESAIIVSRIMAEVTAVRVKPGDRVRAGGILIELDARQLAAARARAQAAVTAARDASRLAAAERQGAQAGLTLATATYKRIEELRSRNSATPHEFDQAQAGLRAAEARLASADAGIAQAEAGIAVAEAAANEATVAATYATLTAPFDGIVTQKMVDPGNMAAPGVPLLSVDDTRGFRLEVRVDESRASLVRLHDAADVIVDAPGDVPSALTGHVAEIARVLDPGAHAFLAKIDLPATEGLRSGMYGRVRFAGPPRRTLAVGSASVNRHGQVTSVFVVDRSNVARLRLVTVGEAMGGLVEVRSGLDAGERVVVDPPATLTDGSPVRPREAALATAGQRKGIAE